MKKIFILSLLLFSFSGVQASIPQKPLLGSGYRTGGIANSGVTLLDLKRIQFANKKTERYAIEFGDRQGQPLVGKPGYFHVELKNGTQPLLIINIAKVVGTEIDAKKINNAIQRSAYLSSPEILQNAEDGSQNIIFKIKKNTPVHIYQVKSKVGASKMVLEVGSNKKI